MDCSLRDTQPVDTEGATVLRDVPNPFKDDEIKLANLIKKLICIEHTYQGNEPCIDTEYYVTFGGLVDIYLLKNERNQMYASIAIFDEREAYGKEYEIATKPVDIYSILEALTNMVEGDMSEFESRCVEEYTIRMLNDALKMFESELRKR